MSSNAFDEALKEAEAQGMTGGKGDYLKLKEGDNKMRLLAGPQFHRSVYNGNTQYKFIFHVVDRRDGKVKPIFVGNRILRNIKDLMESEEYGFKGMPMPYDITIRAKNAGTKEVEYTILPSRKESPITDAEMADLAKQTPLKDLHTKLKEKDALREPQTTTPSPSQPMDGETFDDLAPSGDDVDDPIPFSWVLPLVVGGLLAAHTLLA